MLPLLVVLLVLVLALVLALVLERVLELPDNTLTHNLHQSKMCHQAG